MIEWDSTKQNSYELSHPNIFSLDNAFFHKRFLFLSVSRHKETGRG